MINIHTVEDKSQGEGMKQKQAGETNEAETWTQIGPHDKTFHGYTAGHQTGHAPIQLLAIWFCFSLLHFTVTLHTVYDVQLFYPTWE